MRLGFALREASCFPTLRLESNLQYFSFFGRVNYFVLSPTSQRKSFSLHLISNQFFQHRGNSYSFNQNMYPARSVSYFG